MALIALFTVLAVASWLLLLHPYVIYPWLLSRLPKRPVAKAERDCSVSLLFCAFNEAGSIEQKIANLRRLKERRPDLDILAYDDGSTDGTRDMLEREGDWLTVIRGEGRRGKAAGMKKLASLARGDILVFTDANVLCQPDTIDRLLPYYADPEVGGVCGVLCYRSEDWTPTASVGAQYWSLDERLRALESQTGNVMGADGSIFSIRRELYPDFPDSTLDDFVVSMSVIFAGKRLVSAPDALVFEESVAQSAEEFRRKIRIGTRAFHTHGWMRDRLRQMSALDRFKYFSRKYLRWFGGAFFIAGSASTLAVLALVSRDLFLLAAGGGLLGLLVALKARSGIFAKIGEVLRALIGTLIGVLRGMRGQTVSTWSPATSR